MLIIHYFLHIGAWLIALVLVLWALCYVVFKVSLITRDDVMAFVEGLAGIGIFSCICAVGYFIAHDAVQAQLSSFFLYVLGKQ